jgi:hypothetical protein
VLPNEQINISHVALQQGQILIMPLGISIHLGDWWGKWANEHTIIIYTKHINILKQM